MAELNLDDLELGGCDGCAGTVVALINEVQCLRAELADLREQAAHWEAGYRLAYERPVSGTTARLVSGEITGITIITPERTWCCGGTGDPGSARSAELVTPN